MKRRKRNYRRHPRQARWRNYALVSAILLVSLTAISVGFAAYGQVLTIQGTTLIKAPKQATPTTVKGINQVINSCTSPCSIVITENGTSNGKTKIKTDKTLEIDLQGHALTFGSYDLDAITQNGRTGSIRIFDSVGGGSITVTTGLSYGTSSRGTLTIEGVTINGTGRNATITNSSLGSLYLINSTITSASGAALTTASAGLTFITNSTLTGATAALSGNNGSTTIYSGTFQATGNRATAVAPTGSTVLVYGGTFSDTSFVPYLDPAYTYEQNPLGQYIVRSL